jgi:hypothetical protein
MSTDKDKDKDKSKKKNVRALQERYNTRMTLVKYAQDAKYKEDYMNTIKYYNSYLKLMSEVKEVDIRALGPRNFDQKREVTEIMLISHIYWEEVKILDKVPNLASEFNHTMKKFIEFSTGYEFQFLNAELLRKFIRKNNHRNKEAFKDAYKRLFIGSGKCYIATHCFGVDHPHVENLRLLRNSLAETRPGLEMVRRYYQFSPSWVEFLNKFPRINSLLTPFLRRGLSLISHGVHLFFKN